MSGVFRPRFYSPPRKRWIGTGRKQKGRPISDLSTGGWTNESGGSTLYASIDEILADDADYIKSSAEPVNDVCEVKLTSLGNPQTTSGHIVRYRYEKDNPSSSSMNLTVELRQGATTIASWTHNNIPNAYTTVSQTLTSGQAGAITDYSNLSLRFTANLT